MQNDDNPCPAVDSAIFVLKANPQNSFVVLAIVFGILFLIVTPPYQVSDEFTHFARAYQLSEGKVRALKTPEGKVGGFVPESTTQTALAVIKDLPFHPENKITARQIIAFLNYPLNSDRKVFLEFPNTALYSPVTYLPQTLGTLCGRLLRLSPFRLLYLGRFFSLMAWVALIYMAIKNAPFGRWALFLLALSPTSLFQAASLSADAFTNGLAYVVIALFLRYAFDAQSPLGLKPIMSLFIWNMLLALAKPSYFLFPFLFLLTPVQKIGSRTAYITLFAFLLLSGIGATGLWTWFIKDFYEIYRPNPEISHADQFVFIAIHPLKYVFILMRTHIEEFSNMAYEALGTLGWRDTPLPAALIISYALVLFIAAFFSSTLEPKIRAAQRLIILSTWALSMALTTTIVYVMCTSVGNSYTLGLQGRYFIPMMPLFFLVFCNGRAISERAIEKIRFAWIGYAILSLSVTLVTLIHRYYTG